MVQPKRIGHVVLNVKDLAVSERFYTEILGFQVALKRPAGTFLTCGKIHHDLALFQAPEDAEPVSRGLGLNHFAVQIGDMDELKEVHRRLKSHGAEIDHLTDHGMTKSVYFPRSRREPDRVFLQHDGNCGGRPGDDAGPAPRHHRTSARGRIAPPFEQLEVIRINLWNI